MHYNNVGLLATALLASTATAIPRIPHHVAVAAAGGTSDPSQEGRNVMQRSEEKTASQGNADFLLDTVGGQLGRRSEQKTASKDNADFLFDLGDKTDSEDEGDGQNSRVIHDTMGNEALSRDQRQGQLPSAMRTLCTVLLAMRGFPISAPSGEVAKRRDQRRQQAKTTLTFGGPVVDMVDMAIPTRGLLLDSWEQYLVGSRLENKIDNRRQYGVYNIAM